MNEIRLREMETALQKELERLVTHSSDGDKELGARPVVQQLVELKAWSLAWLSKIWLSNTWPFKDWLSKDWRSKASLLKAWISTAYLSILPNGGARKREWQLVGRLAHACQTGLWRCVPDLRCIWQLGLPGID